MLGKWQRVGVAGCGPLALALAGGRYGPAVTVCVRGRCGAFTPLVWTALSLSCLGGGTKGVVLTETPALIGSRGVVSAQRRCVQGPWCDWVRVGV